MSNIVKAVVGKNGKIIKTAPLYQYDYGQILQIEGIELPEAYQVHFSNDPTGDSTTSVGNADGVAIPDTYLQSGETVYAWLYLHTGEDDGETVLKIEIPVRQRAAITNETPTPQQQSEIDQIIEELNEAVDAAEDAQAAAEEAAEQATAAAEHYPVIVDGYWAFWSEADEQYVKSNQKAQGPQGDPGDPGDPTELIDDASTELNKVWSANKSNTLLSAIQAKYTKPQTGIPATDLANGVIPDIRGKADKEEVEELQQSKAPVILETASGNPIVIDDGAGGMNFRKCKLTLLPRQSGSGDPSPENIRPLLPWGEVGTWTGGKNLFKTTASSKEAAGVKYTVNSDGTITVSGIASGYSDLELGTCFIPTKGKITVSGLQDTTNVRWDVIRLYDKDNNIVVNNLATSSTLPIIIDLSNYPTACKLYLKIKRNNNVETSGTIAPMVEVGETSSEYVPSAITPHPVDLTGITPPVYGCELDLTTGEVWGTFLLDSFKWSTFAEKSTLGTYERRSHVLSAKPVNNNKSKCNVAPYISDYSSDSLHFYCNGTQSKLFAFLPVGTDEETEVVVAYELATPVLLATLTPQQVSALVGVNTVWSEADGVEVEYPADTKLFIAKNQIDIRSTIAPIEDGATASQAYAIGKYFYRNGQFCKAKTAISSGAAFTLNTNYTVTTVADELFALQ